MWWFNFRSRKKKRPKTRFGKITEEQHRCIRNARYNYEFLWKKIADGERSETVERSLLTNCFWYVLLAHVRRLDSVHIGTGIILEAPRIIELATRLKRRVLIPKLSEIVLSENAKEKARLAYEYTHILMASILGPSSEDFTYEVLCYVLDADYLSLGHRRDIARNPGKFLEPLGFKKHEFHMGTEKRVDWNWPFDESSGNSK